MSHAPQPQHHLAEQPAVSPISRASATCCSRQIRRRLAYLLNGCALHAAIWPPTQPTPPEGFDFDFITPTCCSTAYVAEDGARAARRMSYRALVLPETDRMRPNS